MHDVHDGDDNNDMANHSTCWTLPCIMRVSHRYIKVLRSEKVERMKGSTGFSRGMVSLEAHEEGEPMDEKCAFEDSRFQHSC